MKRHLPRRAFLCEPVWAVTSKRPPAAEGRRGALRARKPFTFQPQRHTCPAPENPHWRKALRLQRMWESL
ncbi:hypothetical protein Cadr_000012346 [Camelus dromedarius]|uniref:Uncharacterized protein n=1 Tax=Camelus dromedarius TaxID=9838 RepID=A0A5N4DUU2_CAMDR|nr:hypothetical protein Cadr_000012346 [Camelus dromedarius]